MRNSRKGRFRVWDRSQDSFNGEDLVYNFDSIDELIGGTDGSPGTSGSGGYSGTASKWLGFGDQIPATPTFPGTTNSGVEVQQGRRTLYSVVSGLNYNDVPLGSVIAWWRPTSTVAIPDGWVPCDGRQLNAGEHSYGSGSITVPDLRNKFVLGADPAVPGINAVNGYVLAAGATAADDKNNSSRANGGSVMAAGATGAPGIGYDSGLETVNPATGLRSGSNHKRDLTHLHGAGTLTIKDHTHSIAHTHTVPPHRHHIGTHTHGMDHVHLIPNHTHDLNVDADFFTNQARKSSSDPSDEFALIKSATAGTGSSYRPASRDHIHRIQLKNAGETGTRRLPASADTTLINFKNDNSLWGVAGVGNPHTLGGNGYSIGAVTSSPTVRVVNGLNLNAHTNKRLQTDSATVRSGEASEYTSQALDSALNGSNADGNVTTNGANPAVSGSVIGVAGPTGPRGLLNSTATEALYVNIRPQYVGMLYLIKVKVSTNLI